MGRIAALAVALVAVQPGADAPEVGRAIYEDGNGAEALSATMGTPPWPIAARARACATCHGAAGQGKSEGGVAAPPIDLSTMSQMQAVDRLATALRDGRGADGRTLLAAMPRYAIGDGDLAALTTHVRRLPYPPQPGLGQSTLGIGLDLAGSGLTPVEEDRLRARLGTALAKTNGEGGLFGRELILTSPAGAFLTISWSGLDDRPSLSIVPRPPGAAGCPMCCATLHADIASQLDWLSGWLDGRKLTAVYRGSLTSEFLPPAAARRGDVTVHLGPVAEVPSLPPGPLYLFADFGVPNATLRDRPQTYLVTAVDMTSRLAEVGTLIESDPRFADAPRLANVAIELDRASAILLDALTGVGRRAMRYDVCRALRESVPANYAFSVIEMNEGSILATSSPSETGD